MRSLTATLLAAILVASTTALISTIEPAHAGVEGRLEILTAGTDRYSHAAVISGDGEHVVFSSRASELGDLRFEGAGVERSFVRDLRTGDVELLGGENTQWPTINHDGTVIAFLSPEDLDLSDTVSGGGVFVLDRAAGTLRAYAEGDRYLAGQPHLSDDGTILSIGDTHVVDRTTGEIVPIDLPAHNGKIALSGDGQTIAFASIDDDLVPNDTNRNFDVFLWDRLTRRISLETSGFTIAETPALGRSANDLVFWAQTRSGEFGFYRRSQFGGHDRIVETPRYSPLSLSDDASVIGYSDEVDVYIWADSRVTKLTAGGNGRSTQPSIAGDGRSLTFKSSATNLGTGDINGPKDDIILWRTTGSNDEGRPPAPPLADGPGTSELPYLCEPGGPNWRTVERVEDAPVSVEWIPVGTDTICYDGLVDPCPIAAVTIDDGPQIGRAIRCLSQLEFFCEQPDGGWYRAGSYSLLTGQGGFYGFNTFTGFYEQPPLLTEAGSLTELTRLPGFGETQSDALRLYRAFFRREPDLSGAKYWMGILESGASLDQIASQFALSEEFDNTYGEVSNSVFLDIVYRNVLGRTADPDGKAYWLALLNSGLQRGSAVRWIAAGVEFESAFPYPRNHTASFLLTSESQTRAGVCADR